ncbi:MAG: DUF2130 domain-containing protein [Gammaproteobacteria bacterium]
MSDPTLVCPHCHTEIRLTESLAAPLVEATRREYEARLARKDAETAARTDALRVRERELDAARLAMAQSVAEQVAQEVATARVALAEEEARKARLAFDAELQTRTREVQDLQEVLKVRDTKLAEAQATQAALLRQQRELEDAQRELELTVEKRVQESLGAVRAQSLQQAEEALRLKVAEKDQTIQSMQQTIEELKRKADQGSQQLQGEVQELELESLLRAKFPHDLLEPVAKGESGADLLQQVRSPGGQVGGEILWEAKRTRHWNDGWLVKLREDQRNAKAEVAVIVSHALPRGVESFDVVDGVWVTSPRYALPLAAALRGTLLQVAMTRQQAEGLQTKTELVYAYLIGPRFRHRVEAIVEAFSGLRDDLDRERKATLKQWAKREAQIERVMNATVGMYGDLQGIAGKSLQEIEGLDYPALGYEPDPPS